MVTSDRFSGWTGGLAQWHNKNYLSVYGNIAATPLFLITLQLK
jgi:hypothetical protein